MNLRKLIKWPAFPSLALLIAFVILNCFISEGFANPSAWLGFIQTVSPLTISGRGVGPELAAATLLNDIVRLACSNPSSLSAR